MRRGLTLYPIWYVALTGMKCICWGKMMVKMLFFGGFLGEFAQFAL